MRGVPGPRFDQETGATPRCSSDPSGQHITCFQCDARTRRWSSGVQVRLKSTWSHGPAHADLIPASITHAPATSAQQTVQPHCVDHSVLAACTVQGQARLSAMHLLTATRTCSTRACIIAFVASHQLVKQSPTLLSMQRTQAHLPRGLQHSCCRHCCSTNAARSSRDATRLSESTRVTYVSTQHYLRYAGLPSSSRRTTSTGSSRPSRSCRPRSSGTATSPRCATPSRGYSLPPCSSAPWTSSRSCTHQGSGRPASTGASSPPGPAC